jgi:hypothetical protein
MMEIDDETEYKAPPNLELDVKYPFLISMNLRITVELLI